MDRDGVINVYRPEYLHARTDFVYYDFAPAAFAILGQLELPLVVVTNQSGIARGYQTAAEVDAIHAQLLEDSRSWGGPISEIYVCPHHPRDDCSCRKPRRGLFDRAASDFGIDLGESFMVGDSPADIAAGAALDMTTLRVQTGRGAEPAEVSPNYSIPDLLEAAQLLARLCR